MSEEMKWDMIYSYTRAQAIEDGVLADVSEPAKEAGFKLPVALTAAVWGLIEAIPQEFQGIQDTTGRLWDVLTMAAYAARANKDASLVFFKVDMPNTQGKRTVDLKMICGPGDNAEPVLTIMLPTED